MNSSRRPRTTLSRLMALNAAFALPLAAYRLGFSGLAEYAPFLASAWACLLVFLALNTVLDLVLGIRCPHCRRLTLRRLARSFSWTSYYECSCCGARCKRAMPLARWRDASGPEDDAKYARKPDRGRWLGYSVPDDHDSTCGVLLRSKRGRAAFQDARCSHLQDEASG